MPPVVKMMANLVQLLLYVMSLMPRRGLQQIGTVVGDLSHWRKSRSAQVTRANIELCYPALKCSLPPELISKEAFSKRSLVETGKTLMETPSVWFGNSERIDTWMPVVHNEALLQERLDDTSGLLLLLPHMGNWELLNVFIRRYGEMTALYQPPRQKFMQQVMATVRKRHGNHMVPTTRAGLKQLFQRLKSGQTVVILPDQVPASGQFIPFFGHDALTDVLASRLLQKTGAKALGITFIRNADGLFDVHILTPDDAIYDPDDIVSMTAVNKLMETCAELSPAQYQWDYKRFRERPAGSEKVYRFNKPPGVH